jgi:hypothetical protein
MPSRGDQPNRNVKQSWPSTSKGLSVNAPVKRANLVLIALDEVTTRLCGSDVAAVVPARHGRQHGVHRRQGEEVGRRVRRGQLRQLAREGEASHTYLLERFVVATDEMRAGH